MKQIILRKFLIADGNPTLLVWNCPRAKRPEIINKYLGEVEQVGFVNAKSQLKMMGNELCINALLALKYSQSFKEPTSINLNLQTSEIDGAIILPGIGYVCSNKKVDNIMNFLEKMANKYNLPAFGLVRYKKNKITPFVYVKKTSSLFKETACGSGSVALNIAKNYVNIIQPTREIITVNKSGNFFTISAQVKELNL